MSSPESTPRIHMALCDAEGNVSTILELEPPGGMASAGGRFGWTRLFRPEGSDQFMLPGRRPAGFDRELDEMVVIDEDAF